MEKTTYTIEISNDTPESVQFADWLNAQGHAAKVGRSTGNYIDGQSTSASESANDIMRNLWDAYCNK